MVTGVGKIEGHPAALAVMDFAFMGGSMGTVVGEKIARLIDHAVKHGLGVVVFCASGGARMQEGVLSLMQMAKVAGAIGRLRDAHLPYLSVLCDPTTGGVAASFAMLGDLDLAEPGALIGFAGRRVIEQTTNQVLPEGFQSAEFLLAHGMLDAIVPRAQMRATLGRLLGMLAGRATERSPPQAGASVVLKAQVSGTVRSRPGRPQPRRGRGRGRKNAARIAPRRIVWYVRSPVRACGPAHVVSVAGTPAVETAQFSLEHHRGNPGATADRRRLPGSRYPIRWPALCCLRRSERASRS